MKFKIQNSNSNSSSPLPFNLVTGTVPYLFPILVIGMVPGPGLAPTATISIVF